ncbi:rhodoquinone biosynthesis methyltransferase RquA [Rhodospirillum rubrum]|uniref:Methyltransferase domain-containing protein n=3 Tax=Rhodospirillum rubrum TaxID=1085 RepID=Q2RPC3_RHORT|nr:rhodoquinone biosynthesis methyltransferase RquA [Rhodospirillum rubrum]ABC24022.1 conserved hypothetical protein, potential methyltransferase [Rhodospirillum rubrum ATCC 11170]MBK5955706.1 class I SAM-dependent methyltransferase [Rhodospirillum rubrum]HAP99034.1 class I SAM-dependent methyltransferase [Rhodospirillum rubrum]HCF18160.1 class I SAM-dependent methyltransferase [Rhodospirillum rubrum]
MTKHQGAVRPVGPEESAFPASQSFSETGPVVADPIKPLPAYLQETYTWAYLDPRNVEWLDHEIVVNAILWGNMTRLMATAFKEFEPGQEVLQPACVYGPFSRHLAERLGPEGYLEVHDVAPVQIHHTRRKVEGLPQVTLRRADAADPLDRDFDGVCCFFLLHEVPDHVKSKIVDNMLSAVRPGGKVVFVDYHRYAALHPLRPIMAFVFRTLEPFAWGLCTREISDFASDAGSFTWRKETYFGGLYQKVVAERRA